MQFNSSTDQEVYIYKYDQDLSFRGLLEAGTPVDEDTSRKTRSSKTNSRRPKPMSRRNPVKTWNLLVRSKKAVIEIRGLAEICGLIFVKAESK